MLVLVVGSGAGGGLSEGQLPPEEPTPVGAFRFNTDTAKLEYYDGNQYVNITTDSPFKILVELVDYCWWSIMELRIFKCN